MEIRISDLAVSAVIGEYEHERHAVQPLRFNLRLVTNINVAEVKEDLSKTLDYDALTQRLIAFVEASQYRLLETMAADLSDLLFEDERIVAFDMEIVKPEALEKAEVSLVVSKTRS